MMKRRGRADRGYSRKAHAQRFPAVERCEGRLLMAVFTVTNTSDLTNAAANDGSLRGAILASNATTTANTITFNIPTAGVQTITLAGALPAITDAVTIDGTTAMGYNPATGVPLIQISGSSKSTGADLVATAPNVVIKSLILDDSNGDGVDLDGGTDTVTGCYIGVDPTGNAVAGNFGAGVVVASSGNTIGSPTAPPNVISGDITGIQVTGLATANVISHNFIGTNAAGTAVLKNSSAGISLTTGGNTIGGVSATGPAGAGNLISGNQDTGITISGAGSFGNLIQGNYIGTNLAGTAALGNVGQGVYINDAPGTIVGDDVPAGGNLVSGNSSYGVYILGTPATMNVIEGNHIGVGVNGQTPIGNGDTGVLIDGADFNVVGGTSFSGNSPQFGNIIANNGVTSTTSYGVEIVGATNDGILSNSIYNNGGIGIKLNGGNAGVLPPTITSAESSTAETLLTGTYFGNPNTNYRLQFFSNQAGNPSGSGDGQNYLGDYDVTTNASGSATFTVTFNVPVPVGYVLSSTATQAPESASGDNTSQFGPNIPVAQAAVANLGLTVAVPATGPLLDQPYTYTFTVKNGGPNDASGVVLTDTLPASGSYISSSAGSYDPKTGIFSDAIGAIAANASVTVTLTVNPTQTGPFNSTASVMGNEIDDDTANNTVMTTATVMADADLSIQLTPDASTVAVGSPITYTLNVGNNGPSPATATTVTFTLPSDFTGIVAMPDQGVATVDTNTNTVTINSGIIPASSSSTIIIQATPTATGPATATATVSASPLIDPNPANNSATATVAVANAADLAVDLSSAPDPVLVGNELLYTVVVSNNGPSSATSPVLVDQLPSGVTFVPGDSTPGLSYSNGFVTATLASLAAGDSVTLTIAVIPTASGQITDTATIGDPNETSPVEIDPDLTNNTASTTTQVSPADIGVNVINPPDPLSINQDAVFQIQVLNNGPATATNVMLADTFSGAATIISTSAGTISGQGLTVNLGSLASGATTTVTVTVVPKASGTLVNSASVTSDELDPDPNNNTSSSSNLVSPVDVGVTLTSSPGPIIAGQSLAYVATVTNAGPSAATNVIFTDTLPAGSVLTYLLSTQGAFISTGAESFVGDIGTLAPGASATITIKVTPTLVGTASDVASVKSDEFDTNTDNNSATSDVVVVNQPGTIAFGTNQVVVPEDAGSVTLTVERTAGNLGAVSARFTTANASAVAGVNYVATSGTVTFAAGQSIATITIPVLDDNVVDGTNGFFVVLSDPTGGATIGAQGAIAVAVTNVDRDLVPPVVSNLIAIPNGSQINGFVITFDKAIDPARASLLGNYYVFLSGKGNAQTPVALVAANYDPATDSVTLVPSAPLPSNRFYHIVVNGSYGLALTSLNGVPLSGSSGPGSNYEAYYGQGNNLTYNDSENNSVNIKLTGGGTLAIFRAANGNATTVDLYGIVPYRTKISGTVKKLNRLGTGHTSIGSINGFGQFGVVKSSLTTPAFYVGSAPVTEASVAAGPAVSVPNPVAASSATTALVTLKKKTPKGPHHSSK